MERILNLTCPGCGTGVEYDTALKNTKEIKASEYPELNEDGRCWCKVCQHGTYPIASGENQGLCSECVGKGRANRLQPKEDAINNKPVEKVENVITTDKETITTTNLHKQEIKPKSTKETSKGSGSPKTLQFLRTLNAVKKGGCNG